MADWFALFTYPQKEPLAADELVRCKFTVLFPYVPEWRALKSKPRTIRKAYYPRYVFVQACDWDLATVAHAPGVAGIVRGTDRWPFRLAEAAIQRVLDITDPTGAVHQDPPQSKYGLLRGQKVKFREGSSLWGLAGTIAAVHGERVEVTLKMLASDRQISVKSQDVVGELTGTHDLSR